MSRLVTFSVVDCESGAVVSMTCRADRSSPRPLNTVARLISEYLKALDSSWPKEPTPGEPLGDQALFGTGAGISALGNICPECLGWEKIMQTGLCRCSPRST